MSWKNAKNLPNYKNRPNIKVMKKKKQLQGKTYAYQGIEPPIMIVKSKRGVIFFQPQKINEHNFV